MSNRHVWEEQGKKIPADNKSNWYKGPGVGVLWETRVLGVDLEKVGIDCHRRIRRNGANHLGLCKPQHGIWT